jgi:hypothetical protein
MGFIETDVDYGNLIKLEVSKVGSLASTNGFRFSVYTDDDWNMDFSSLADAYHYAADRFLDLEHAERINQLQERINKL